MLDFLTYSSDKLQLLLLLNFRVAGLFLTAPVFSHRAIPPMVKVALVLTLSLALLPAASHSVAPPMKSVFDLALIAGKEFLVGVIMGLVVSLVFIAINMAGSLVGLQSGLSIASIIDPATADEVNIFGEFWTITALVIFFGINGHHALLSGLGDSYRVLPIGTALLTGTVAESLMRLSAGLFSMAIKFAAPVMLTLLLMEVALGVLARTMPQMNVFVIGIPVKIAVSLFVVAASLPMFGWVMSKMVVYLNEQMGNISGALASR